MAYTQVNTSQIKAPAIKDYPALDWQITDNDLIELARSLYAANISFNKGKSTTFIDIERRLEVFFNRKVIRPHHKVTRISERMDVSSFLDLLKDSYIKDLESRL